MDNSWIPRFLRESGVRSALQELYAGMTLVTKNADILSKTDISSIKRNTIHGTPLAAKCFMLSVQWLRYLRDFALCEEVFRGQFLEPAVASAKFIIEAREVSPFSMKLQGCVICKSPKFHSQNFLADMQIITIAVPELGSVLSMRCRIEDAKGIHYGNHTIQGVQPIPFINRIHPTRLKIEPSDARTDLRKLHFCKISFRDVDCFTRSIAFENLCEAWSEQIYDDDAGRHGRRLGAVCILGGLVLGAGNGPFITVRDPCESRSKSGHRFYVTTKVLKELGVDLVGLSDWRGRLVRFMAIFWYGQGRKSVPPCPEIIDLEFVEDINELIEDDLIGLVRLRLEVSQKSIEDVYGKTMLSFSPNPLLTNDNCLYYDFGMTSQSRIGNIFLEKQDRIRSLRQEIILSDKSDQEKLLTIEPSIILNMDRLELKGMAEWLTRNPRLLYCLIALMMRRDYEGSLPSNLKEFTIYGEKCPCFSRESFGWLRTLDLIHRNRGMPIKITERGVNVTYLALEEKIAQRLKEILSSTVLLDLVGLETRIPLPPTVLLKALRDLEKKHVANSVPLDGSGSELFWSGSKKVEISAKGEALRRMQSLEKDVIAALNSVLHPLGTVRILEKVRENGKTVSLPSITIVLSILRKQGRIEEHEHGVWFYPPKTRVADILKENPMDAFTLEEITVKASFALEANQLREILENLRDLENSGAAEEVLDGYWSISLPEKNDEGKGRAFKCACRKRVLSIMKESGGKIRTDRLHHEIMMFLFAAKKKSGTTGSYEVAREIINEMETNGEVRAVGDFHMLVH